MLGRILFVRISERSFKLTGLGWEFLSTDQFFLLLLDPLLLIRLRDDVLERVNALLFQFDAQLLCRLLDNARRQIDLESQFLADCHTICFGKND